MVGATGSIGAPVAAALAGRGHEVRALSRRAAEYPVDLETGSGLAAALEGADAVVDASNAGPDTHAAERLLLEGGRRLLAAEREAGIGHHLCISIVGIEHVPLGYYGVKVEQERLVRESGLPFSILRSTQFHTLAAMMFAGLSRFRLMPSFSFPLQPVDTLEVAEVVAGAVETPTGATATIAGPRVESAGELLRQWRRHAERRTLQVRTPLPGSLGKALRAGALTDERPDHRGRVSFAEWLARG